MSDSAFQSERLLSTSHGVSINYLDSETNGPPVVILHGLAGSAREFVPTARALPGFRTILMDLRGHGGSTRRPLDLSRAAFVADAISVIEQRVNRPVSLVGHSMGGHTAMLVAANRPDLVSRLVLLEAGQGSGAPEVYEDLGKYFHSWPVPFAGRDAARRYLGDGALQRAWAEDLEQRDDGFWPRFEPDVMVEIMAGVAAPRWQEWESIGCPTLVVYGSQGMFTEPEREEFIRRGKNVKREDIIGASHDAHLDNSEQWTSLLRWFLTEDSAAFGAD